MICNTCGNKIGIIGFFTSNLLKDGQICKKCSKKLVENGLDLEIGESQEYTIQEINAIFSEPEAWKETIKIRHTEYKTKYEEQLKLKEKNKHCLLCGKEVSFFSRFMTADNRALCTKCTDSVITICPDEFFQKKNSVYKYVEEHDSNFFIENMGHIEHPHPSLSVNFTKRCFYYRYESNPNCIFTFDSVIKFESNSETYNITVGKKGHPIARAIVGGTLFGPAGAIIGTMTSKNTQHLETKEGDEYINIYYKDITQKTGVRKITFNSWDDTVIVNLKDCLKRVFEINNQKNDYSQLIELKNLLDINIITQEEFDKKKNDILNI